MAVSSNDTFVDQLVKVLGLPKQTIRFSLNVAVNEAVIVTCEYYPELSGDVKLTHLFELNRIDPTDYSVWRSPYLR